MVIYCEHYLVFPDGTIYSLRKSKPLKPNLVGKGYHTVSLYNNGRLYVEYVHRIIARCYVDNTENYKEVHHINGDNTDNRVSNLAWIDTTTHQQLHRAKRYRIIAPNNVVWFFKNVREFGRRFNLSHGGIRYIIAGKRKHYKKWRV